MTSSIRDQPATLPSSLPTTQTIDPIKDLVNRLLDSALSAPDPEPPEDAKPPMEVKGSKWGRAPPPKPQPIRASGGSRKNTRSNKGQGADEDEAPKLSGITIGAVRNLVTYGKRGQSASTIFRTGQLPLDLSMDVVRAELGKGSFEEE
jgi:hypothetical protein